MAKLRHLALSVKDLEESAKFYESAFGMERVRQSDVAIMLSDGVVRDDIASTVDHFHRSRFCSRAGLLLSVHVVEEAFDFDRQPWEVGA